MSEQMDEKEVRANSGKPTVSDGGRVTGERAASGVAAPPGAETQTKLSYSRGFGEWMAANRTSLAFSCYQTGNVFAIGIDPKGRVGVSHRNFVRAMGLWTNTQQLLIASLYQIFRLENVLKRNEQANGRNDKVYVPRNVSITGDLDVHELAVDKSGRVIFVNTKYSCVAAPSVSHSFRPIWKPKFISRLAAEDRCHLNGLAMVEGEPRYVTAVSRSDLLGGWRHRRQEGGVIIDVSDDRIITDQLSMPHSPRFVGRTLWVLDSGRGYIVRVDQRTGKRENVAFCPGFLRGLSIRGNFAAVTVSLPRDGVFRDLELDQNLKTRDGEPWCGVLIVDLRGGEIVEWLKLEGQVKELFDVVMLPGVRLPRVLGPESPEVRSLITIEGRRSEQIRLQEEGAPDPAVTSSADPTTGHAPA